MEIRYKQVETINEFIDYIRLRVDVFIKEQKFEPGWEPDEDDKISKHFIALTNNKVISTARFKEEKKGEFHIGRMTTKKEYRRKGIAKKLVGFMVNEIMKLKPKRIWLNSQVQAQKFYGKCGFKAVSEPFDMHGIPHVEMEYKVR
tara:strand:+ start:250 stop:684 length:435 start_codon:yes stop_codon:yes gene_type:complete